MDLVPVLLAADEQEFDRKLEMARSYTSYIQIDFMDGLFVPQTTIGPEKLLGKELKCEFEAHMMVADPLIYLAALKDASAKRIIFHIESVKDPMRVIGGIRNMGVLPGVAINPFTSVYPVKALLPEIETLLLLAVDPQATDSKFYPEITNKLEFLDSVPGLRVGIDGGIKRSNIKKVLDNKVNYVCAGSAIFDKGDPYQNYLSLKEAIKH